MGYIKQINTLLIQALAIAFLACNSTPEIDPATLDGTVIYDPSINNPEDYLLSYAKPNPDQSERTQPVFITLHGYSATTYEWSEFREWSSNRSDYYLSQVLLGGHGLSYEEFKKASWKDWQKSITEEYERLITAGYININFICSSASCALMVDLLATGYFEGIVTPKNILMIDPFVIPSDKSLSLVGIIGPMLGYVEADNTSEEDLYWYHFRPQETLQELQKVITEVRKQLQKGVAIPENCLVKVYKSVKDPTADPTGAVLLYKGLKPHSGSKIDLEMIDSDLHVFTRLSLRETITSKDLDNQEKAFEDFLNRAGI